MRTLADVRRRMTPGTRLEVVKQTILPEQVGKVRVVRRSRSANIQWEPDTEGGRWSWSDWPKAKNLRVIDDDTYEYDLVDRDGEVQGTIGLRFLQDEGAS